jgi:hypothetical protein
MSSDTRSNDTGTTVVLIAVEVRASSQAEAQELMRQPSLAGQHVESWWFAEDDRHDGSDLDSAVFVPMGEQAQWAEQVRAARDLPDRLDVTLYDGGLEVGNPHVPAEAAALRPAGALMFGVVTEESEDEDEEGCYDYVLGHWPNGEEWVELQRWPVDWDVAASMREVSE